MAKKQTYHHGNLRQALLEAALVLLQTKDADSLSLREVARQAGVSHTAPYRHFADKAALLAAVAEEGFITFGQYLSDAVTKAHADPLESLQATGEAYLTLPGLKARGFFFQQAYLLSKSGLSFNSGMLSRSVFSI